MSTPTSILTAFAVLGPSGFGAWKAIITVRCHRDNVARLAAAKESGADFDLPAALSHVRPGAESKEVLRRPRIRQRMPGR